MSLISLTGNATTLTFSGNGSAERRWTDWLLGLKAFAIYGQTRPTSGATATEVAAMAGGAQIRGDRVLTNLLSVYLLTGGETDHVKSVEFRGYGEAGTGLTWIDRREADYQKTLLRTDLAVRYARELRFQYYPTAVQVPDVDILGPRVGLVFRHALSKDVLFTEELELLPSLLGSSRLLMNSMTKLSSRLTESFALAVAFLVNHDTLPAAGKLSTDTALTAGIEVKL